MVKLLTRLGDAWAVLLGRKSVVPEKVGANQVVILKRELDTLQSSSDMGSMAIAFIFGHGGSKEWLQFVDNVKSQPELE